MYVGRINKETEDVSRFTVDLTPWLDDGEVATEILTHTITLGTTGWSDTPYPPPGSPPPYDPTPLLYTVVQLVDGGTGVEVYVSYGTPGNVYTCQLEVIGTTLREVNFEVGVQITGDPPAAPPVVLKPISLDALSIYGGTMLGPLYLYQDPLYPTEAATKQYVDWSVSVLHVENKVDRSGDVMTGFLQLYANPVQPLQAATKAYVDMQIGSTLSDAPTDMFYYGRHNLTWAKVTEEAPLDTWGYLRSNGAWTRGVPEIGANIDVRVTDNNGGSLPSLTGMVTPFSAATDYFTVGARRTSTGAVGDGGLVQVFGSSYTGLPNGVQIATGTRTAGKFWTFSQVGDLGAPGNIYAAAQVRSGNGQILSYRTDGGAPVVFGYDTAHGVASGFYVGSAGELVFGPFTAAGNSAGAWASLTSTGLYVPAAITVGSSLNVTGSVISNGSLYARGGNVFFGPGDTAVLASDGTNMTFRFRSDNYSLFWNGSSGVLSFQRPGFTMWYVDPSGNGYFGGQLNVQGPIVAQGNITASGATVVGVNLQAVNNTLTNTLNANSAQIGSLNVSGDTVSGRIISNNGSTNPVGGYYYSPSGQTPFSSGGLAGFGFIASGGGPYMLASGFFASSDARVKTNIAAITPQMGVDWVTASKPCEYDRKHFYNDDDPAGYVHEAGFIAQEQITAGYPRFVNSAPCDGMPAYDDGTLQIPANTQLSIEVRYQIAMLTAACQGILDRISTLEARAGA